jgi:hypothetical protein
MAIDRNLLVPLDTVQAEFRAELGRFVDAFNALIETYVALQFASLAELNAGVEDRMAISPAVFAEHMRTQRFSAANVSAGAEDAGRAPRLGAAGTLNISFLPRATPQQMETGLDDTVLVTAQGFAVELTNRLVAALEAALSTGPQSAGPADEGKAPVLNAAGQLDASYINPVPSKYVGAMDATLNGGGITPPIVNGSNQHQVGAYTVVMIEGTYDFARGVPDPGGVFLTPLDVCYFDGAKWDRISNPMEIGEFLRRDGSTSMRGNLTFDFPVLSGPEKQIIGAVIDCGTF